MVLGRRGGSGRPLTRPARPGLDRRVLLAYGLLVTATIVLAVLGAAGIVSTNVMRYLLQVFLYVALGEAWNLLSGFAGMTSLGQQLYVGLAGYAMAVMSSTYHQGLAAGLAVGVVLAVVASLLMSGILLRLDGMYLAIGTWVAAEAMEKVFLNWGFVGQGSGMVVTLSPYPPIRELYLIALVLGAVAVATVLFVLRSKLGLGLLAMRDDAIAAETSGIDIRRHRLIVYVIACVLAAAAGGVFFVNKGTIYPDSGFSVGWTVAVVFICIVGGSSTVTGPIAGSVIYVVLQEYLAHYPGWSNIMLGLVTLVVIFFLPEGIMGGLLKAIGFKPIYARSSHEDG